MGTLQYIKRGGENKMTSARWQKKEISRLNLLKETLIELLYTTGRFCNSTMSLWYRVRGQKQESDYMRKE